MSWKGHGKVIEIHSWISVWTMIEDGGQTEGVWCEVQWVTEPAHKPVLEPLAASR